MLLKNIVERHLPNESKTKKSKLVELKSSLNEYHAINELRLINNSIKHEGKVSPSLAKEYSFWVAGEEITDLHNVYSRLNKKVIGYLIGHEEHIKKYAQQVLVLD